MLAQYYPSYKTVHRCFEHWCERDVLRDILSELVNTLREGGELDERERFIDGMIASARGGSDEVGKTKHDKGVKILAIVDRPGLPLSVGAHALNYREVMLIQVSFEFYPIEGKPENLIGDRAYDIDRLDNELKTDGVEMLALHCSNRRTEKSQDGRPLRRYARRWFVERLFA